MEFVDFLNVGLALGGAIIFVFCIGMVSKILKLLPQAQITKQWKIIQALVAFFLIGYVINIYSVIIGNRPLLYIMQAFVYFFGALFVFIVVKLSLKTYKMILDTAESNES